MAEALLDAMVAAVPSTSEYVWRFNSYKSYMRKYNDLVQRVAEIVGNIDAPVDLYNLDAVPGATSTIAMQQQGYFEDVRANLSILKAYLQNRVNPKSDRIVGIADFFQANLRRAVLQKPEREKEVQDVVEQLLIGRGFEQGLDYDRESGRVRVSSKEVIPDFNLIQLSTAVEVKLVKESTKLGSTIDEINADITAYLKMYAAVVFVVYDVTGGIRDDAEFRRDLEAADGVRVIVIKH